MKKLAVITLAVVLTSIRLSAETTLFDPNFSNQTGYTTVTANGGTTTTSGDTLTAGDVSNTVQAYATATAQNNGGDVIQSQFTFTPTFTANPNFSDYNTTYSGNYEGIQLFTIYGGGNNALLNVQLNISTYNNDDQLRVSSGLQYGSGTLTGPDPTMGNPAGNNSQYYAPGNINSLSGQTLTFTDTLTLDNSNENMTTFAGFVLTNHAVLTNSQGQVLYTFDYTNTSGDHDSIVNSGYNPANSALTFSVGDVSDYAPPSYVSGTTTPNGNFLNSPATVTFSDVSVTIPEPSTYAMLLSGLALLVAGIRRRIVG